MSTLPNTRSKRTLVSSLAFAAALIAFAVALHRPLIAWFTGKSTGGSEGKPVLVTAGPFTLKAALDPDPPRQEGNALVLDVKDASGQPVDDASVDVFFDMPAMGAMAEMKGRAKISNEKGGRYRAEFDLPMGSGTWTLKTAIHGKQGEAAQDFTMTIASAGLGAGGGSGGAVATPGSPASGAMGAHLAPAIYPPLAVDALRSAMDGYERTRSTLAADKLAPVASEARSTAEALRAASASMTTDYPDAAQDAKRAADNADRMASAKTLDEARKAFAALNGDFLVMIGADPRLVSGTHVFECGMFEGHPRWMQRAATPENPYMGKKMPTCGAPSPWEDAAPAMNGAGAVKGEVDHYTCSMHPSVKQNGPGKCPICGMDLIPVTKEQQEQGVVTIDETRRQLIGVRTAKVVLAPFRTSFRAVGHVSYDESKLTDVSLKVRGWITKLNVNQTGQRVARGQPLFSLYSPELYNAEQDFVLALKGSPTGATGMGGGRVEGLATAARQRLRLLGMGEPEVDAIEKRGAPIESVAFASPASGFIIEKDVVEGASVEPGMRLFRIAAIDRVWVEAEVYEADLANVRVGQHAEVSLDYLQGRSYDAKVAYVYPYLDPKTRTGRVRIELGNTDLELRPGMFASVELTADTGPRIQVPAGAVVYTGPRRLVFVDLGEGRFKPQEVVIGSESDGMYEVRSGLRPGDVVASSGVFLIAAEARIRTAAKYWESSTEDAGAPAAMPMPSSSMTSAPAMGSPMREGRPTRPPPAPQPSPSPTQRSVPGSVSASPSASAPLAVIYTCPMHPEVQSPQPGKCPKCGMDLVQKAGPR
jgi:Cu(I)/Ag(I) efflux system membrane fusion protein